MKNTTKLLFAILAIIYYMLWVYVFKEIYIRLPILAKEAVTHEARF